MLNAAAGNNAGGTAAPRKVRGSRRPERPARCDDVLRSFKHGQELAIPASTQADAEVYVSELRSALHWLNTWDGHDIRCRPRVSPPFSRSYQGRPIAKWVVTFKAEKPKNVGQRAGRKYATAV